MKEITIGGGNHLPCLHCGEMIDLEGEIHLCDAPKGEWLHESDVAIMQMPNGDLWDMKNKKIIKQVKQ